MSSCCARPTGGSAPCPRCGMAGKAIAHITPESLLKPELKALLRSDLDYNFCANPTCPVAYFATNGTQVFEQAELSISIWQKCPGNEQVPVCYCFGHTPASIREEVEATGNSTVVAAITAKVKSGLCACEVNNPQGSCCLGNVQGVTKQAKVKTASQATPTVSL